MPRVRAVRVVVACLIVGWGCGGEPRPKTATEAVHAYCGDDYVSVERRIDRLLRRMTLDQKSEITVGQFVSPVWHVPGVDELGIPPFVMIDGPRGVAASSGDVATAFPVGIARGASFDPDLERRVGQAIGREVRASGRNVLLAPTVNVLRHPRWGRAQETYGEDPYHLGIMGTAFVEGAQAEVPVTLKHYAVNSIENTRLSVDVTVDERTLREVYLPHFQRIVRDGHVASVMSSYNSINGAYASENATLLREILKNEWGFAGFVVSDWGGTIGNTATENHTVRAAMAGLDLEMFAPNIYGTRLVEAVLEGALDESVVDDMVRRVLRAKFCFELDSNPPVRDTSLLGSDEARALAREAAERSIVLLRNEGGALPITRGAGTTIVVAGPLANAENLGDTGSSDVETSGIVTALEGLVAEAQGSTVTHVATTTDPADELAIAAADVVIVVAGLTAVDEGEAALGAGDRTSLALPPAQQQAIVDAAALSSKVVVVLEGGSALTLGSLVDDVEAIVMAWYPGVEGGNAIARVLYGDVNPSGRLPLVFPVAESDLPAFDNVSTSVTYGYLHGYRYLDTNATAPLYPFGFGLSYTSFAYGALVVEQDGEDAYGGSSVIHASVDVTNTGARSGRETVQLYVGRPDSTVSPRAPRDLRAFAQVELAPGETRRVTLDVPLADLGFWDVGSHAFVVEPTTYRFEVGGSSRSLPLSQDLAITH